ncbi:MAG: hypothetical protein K1X79_07070 [Oligoflexia bacterium]|nr:hypothetical protein [Oligoflexia bacterium]
MPNTSHPFGRVRPTSQIQVPAHLRQGSVRYAAKQISIPFVTASAISLISLFTGGAILIAESDLGGGKKGCVDENGTVVSDDKCKDDTPSNTVRHYPYRWHYGSRSYHLGTSVVGGSFNPPASTTTRGIFGGHGFHLSFGS